MQEPRAQYITKEYIDLMYWNFCMGLLHALSSVHGEEKPTDSDKIVEEFQKIADGRADSMATRYALRPTSRIVFIYDNGVFQVQTKPHSSC